VYGKIWEGIGASGSRYLAKLEWIGGIAIWNLTEDQEKQNLSKTEDGILR
jgi:hypothetical protein